MSIPDLITKNNHEFARLMEELLSKAGEGIKSIILLNSEIKAERYKIDRVGLDVQQKFTGEVVPTQAQGNVDVEVSRKSSEGQDPIQGLKNVTGTGVVAKTAAEAIQQGKDNQAKTNSIVYLRDNLEPGVPVRLKDGSILTSLSTDDGIVNIEVEKDGHKQSIGKVNEAGLVAVNPAYSNEQLETIQELIDRKQVERPTQVSQSTAVEQQQPSSVEVQTAPTLVTKRELNNLQAYLYSDDYKKEHPDASREAANNKMAPHQNKYMEQAREEHGSDLGTTDPILNSQKYEVNLSSEDAKNIHVANKWAEQREAREEAKRELSHKGHISR
jgi:hypothetical protein